MTRNVKSILRSLKRGEIDAEHNPQKIEGFPPESTVHTRRYLSVLVTDVISERSKYHVRIPVEFIRAGLDIGALFAPELRELDFSQIIEDLDHYSDGILLEVEDFNSREKMVLSISRE